MNALLQGSGQQAGHLREEHFAFADALRAVAILLVVLTHVPLPVARDAEFQRAFGGWGVDAFFVLSGFLLGKPYLEAILRLRPMPDAALYLRRRFLRIWPAYAVVVVASATVEKICQCSGQRTGLRDVAAHLAMIHNLFPAYVWGAGNAALWTMAVDAQFYVVLPVAALVLYRVTDSDAGRTTRITVGVLLAAIALSVAWRLISPAFFPAVDIVPTIDVVQRGLPGMFFCFACGMLLALARVSKFRPSAAVARGLGLSGVAVAGILLAVPYILADPTAAVIDVLGTISVSLIILSWPNLDAAPLRRVIESEAVAIVAAHAYALYLVHYPIIGMLASILESLHVHAGTVTFTALLALSFVPAAAIAASLLHRFVEQPFLTLKERARETSTVQGFGIAGARRATSQ